MVASQVASALFNLIIEIGPGAPNNPDLAHAKTRHSKAGQKGSGTGRLDRVRMRIRVDATILRDRMINMEHSVSLRFRLVRAPFSRDASSRYVLFVSIVACLILSHQYVEVQNREVAIRSPLPLEPETRSPVLLEASSNLDTSRTVFYSKGVRSLPSYAALPDPR